MNPILHHSKRIGIVLFMILITCLKVIGQETNISTTAFFDGEPYLAINPKNNQHLVVAWMGYVFGSGSGLTIRVKVSENGGQSWSSAVNLPHANSAYKSADPSLRFDRMGNVFLCYIDYKESPDEGGIYISKSSDKGYTWSSPIKALDAGIDGSKTPIDRPWFSVDTNGVNIGITSKPAPWISAPNRAYFVHSSDGGNNWSPWRYLDTTNYFVGNSIKEPMAVNGYCYDGTFVGIYPSYVPAQSVFAQFILAKSTNGGIKFNYSLFLPSTGGSTNDSAKVGYSMDINPANQNHYILVYCSGKSGDYDIYFTETTDAGNNWSTPVRINDDTNANGKMQDLAWCAFDSDGDIAITWRDRRNCTKSNNAYACPYEFYYSTRKAGTTTFSMNKKIIQESVAFDNVLAQNGNDFMCCVFRNDTLHTTWGDTRSGSLDIWYNKFSVFESNSIFKSVIHSDKVCIPYPNPTNESFSLSEVLNEILLNYTLVGQDGKIYTSYISYKNNRFYLAEQIPNGIYILYGETQKGNFKSQIMVKK